MIIEGPYGRGISLKVFLVEKLGNFLLFGLDELENVIILVDSDEELLVHTLFHGHNKLSCLYKFTDGLFTIEPPLDGHLHRAGNLLDLAEAVFID